MPVRHLTVTSCKFSHASSTSNSYFLPIIAVFIFYFFECSFWVGPAHGWVSTTHHYNDPCTLCQIVILKNIGVQCSLVSERALLFWNSPSLCLSILLVRATCDEREYGICGMLLAEENRSTRRETTLSVTLSSMNPLWTGLQLYLGIRSYVRSVTNCLCDGMARRREREYKKDIGFKYKLLEKHTCE
jgi:hypothetical protein